MVVLTTLARHLEKGGLGLAIMEVRYYIDLETNLSHIRSHEVTEEEVEQVLLKPEADRPGQDGSRVAIGQTQAGRYIRVIYVPDPRPTSIFVITAYELRGKPLIAYKRRRRKKRR